MSAYVILNLILDDYVTNVMMICCDVLHAILIRGELQYVFVHVHDCEKVET